MFWYKKHILWDFHSVTDILVQQNKLSWLGVIVLLPNLLKLKYPLKGEWKDFNEIYGEENSYHPTSVVLE